MRIFIAVAAVLCVGLAMVHAAQLTPEEEQRIFNHWLKKHKIKVPHTEAAEKWKKAVIAKLNEIEAHNEDFRSGKESFERELNHLSHLSPEEFRKTHHGISKPDGYKHDESKVAPVRNRTRRATDDLPNYFNWADLGVLQPIQYQGQCGSCYSFAGVAAIEAHACKNFGQCVKLSEQETMECTNKCDGGWDEWVYKYSKDSNGLTKETDYEYYATPVNQCEADVKYFPRVSKTKVSDWVILPNDEYTIRHSLYNNGPMWVAFQAYDNIQNYKHGVYDKTSGEFGLHAVLLVGYGTERGKDYWIIRNSWG